MTPDRYQQVMEVFLAAARLEGKARQEYLNRTCQDDPQLRQEVDQLLTHHHPGTISTVPPESLGKSVRQTARRLLPPGFDRLGRRQGLRPWVMAGILAAATTAVGIWLYYEIRATLRESLRNELNLVLNANVVALEKWVEEKMAEVDGWTQDPDIQRLVNELVRASESESPAPSSDLVPLRAELMSLFDPVRALSERKGIGVVSSRGVSLAHTNEEIIGCEVAPAGGEYLRRVGLGETILVKPTKEQMYVGGHLQEPASPLLAVVAPIRNEVGQVVAGLSFAFDADEEFTELLSVSIDRTGETYAFDGQAVLLSRVGDHEELWKCKLLPENQEAPLNLKIRDPGLKPTEGSPELDVELLPLTTMAASATAGRTSENIDGYRNYRGVPVVGAWTWLFDLELAVGTELEYEEAYAPLTYVATAFLLLILIVVGLAFAVTLATSSMAHLKRQVADARELGQYTLDKLIGRGGMGKVYRARHVLLKRPTAVKLLDGEHADAETVARFEREVQLTSQLTHPNTIQIYDFGRTPDGVFYYAMELIDGVNLAQLVARDQRISPARVIYIWRQICYSLREAHALGIIHRDLKPANIMLCRRGGLFDVVKVLDFGLARKIDAVGDPLLTRPNQLGGTPRYIAPERLTSPAEVDGRSDIYSSAAVIYFLLTGQEIFAGEPPLKAMLQSVGSSAPQPSDVDGVVIPDPLNQLVQSGLAADPVDRPADIGQILSQLDQLAEQFVWDQPQATKWWRDDEVKSANAESSMK